MGRNRSHQVRNAGEGRRVNMGSTLGLVPFDGRWWVGTMITKPIEPAGLLGKGCLRSGCLALRKVDGRREKEFLPCCGIPSHSLES